jgi:alpha-ribazole phosphatase
MRLYMIRHARPASEPDYCYGRTDLPVALNDQARIVDSLQQTLPADLPLFCSPLTRCLGLARALADSGVCAAPSVDERLNEIHFGSWEMQPWSQIGRAEIDEWAADLLHYQPGGGENILQAAERVRSFYLERLQSGVPAAIVVCHAITMRLLQRCVAADSARAIAMSAVQAPNTIAYGELVILDSDRAWIS